jgi:hypothetical protein
MAADFPIWVVARCHTTGTVKFRMKVSPNQKKLYCFAWIKLCALYVYTLQLCLFYARQLKEANGIAPRPRSENCPSTHAYLWKKKKKEEEEEEKKKEEEEEEEEEEKKRKRRRGRRRRGGRRRRICFICEVTGNSKRPNAIIN